MWGKGARLVAGGRGVRAGVQEVRWGLTGDRWRKEKGEGCAVGDKCPNCVGRGVKRVGRGQIV